MTATAFDFEREFERKVTSRIIGEVRGVSRVFFDATSKPPGTIEFQ